MLKLNNITKIFKNNSYKIFALNNISYSFEDSKFYSISGPSGSGKSTLLNILSLLSEQTEGNYYIDNKNTSKMTDNIKSKYRNSYFGFVVQDFDLLESETVLFNIELPAIIGKKKKDSIKKKENNILKYLGIFDEKNKKVSNLSGGQKQRVAIARALINSPKVILADEPTGALDHENGLNVINILKELSHNHNITVIMVTHNIEFAELADVRLVLEDGRLKEL